MLTLLQRLSNVPVFSQRKLITDRFHSYELVTSPGYRPQTKFAKVMFLHLSVILFTGGCLPQCMLGYTPSGADTPWSRHPPGADIPSQQTPLEQTPTPEQTPPGADTPEQTPPTPWEQTLPLSRHPPEQTPPRSRHPPAYCILGDTGNKRAVRILLECILVFC